MENNQFRAHQSAANVAITAELESADRCLVKMFCGTGKSLVMRNCDVVKHKNLAVYVLPSLALISQFRRDYLGSVPNANKLFICSEDRDPDIQITTDHTLIQQFVKCSGDKVICVTYDSLGTLFSNLSGVRIDVIVYDEAHHTVEQNNYERIYNESNMYCDKHVFFTATPNNNNGIVMFDRDSDKAADCGKCVFEYTYLDGVRDGIINPFEIRVDVSSRFQGNDVDRVYESIARTILTTGNSRVLTFHSGVNGDDDTSVKNFVNPGAFRAAFNRVISEEFHEKAGQYKNINMSGLYAGLDKKLRESILKYGLDVSPDNAIYIVSSCMTIGEGVDTKKANMCVFVDPKKSHVNIIQNIGRVLRKQAGCSTVLIPCLVNKDDYVDCGEDAEKRDEVIRNDMKTGGDFSSILNVMAALRQEDPDLYDMCLNVGDDDSDYSVADSDDDIEYSDDSICYDMDEKSGENKDIRACKLTVFMSSDLSILWNISSAGFNNEVCSAVLECNIKYDAMETAIGIVERGNDRVTNGGALLPRKISKQNKITPELEQENKDACKMGNWKMALSGRKNVRCSDEVRYYLDLNMPEWRTGLDEKAMEFAREIVERANDRVRNGGALLPRHIAKQNQITAELKQEKKDSTKISHFIKALNGGKNGRCSDAVRDYLDLNMSGWQTKIDFDEQSMEFAREIVCRANERVRDGRTLLPRQIPQQNRTTPELKQEHKDATKISNLKLAFNGKSDCRCSDELRDYLDLNMPGWRTNIDLDKKAMEFAVGIVERGNERVRNKGQLLPRFIQKKNRTTPELNREYKDATKISQLRMALDGNNRANCSDEMRDYLDLNMPGWRTDLDSQAMEFVIGIVQRANDRVLVGGRLLPRQIPMQNITTPELRQEHKDATKISNLKLAVNGGKGTCRCSDTVRDYLDLNLPGWSNMMDLDEQAMEFAREIVLRANNRVQNGGRLLPRQIEKIKQTTPELIQEHKDATKISNFKKALNGAKRTNCSDAVRDYLDLNMPGWSDKIDLDEQAIEFAREIIVRANKRVRNGGRFLPRQIPSKNRTTTELKQEHKDATKICMLKLALSGKGNYRCSDKVRDYLNLNMPGWRTDNNKIPAPISVPNIIYTGKKITVRIPKKSHVIPMNTNNTPSIACAPDHKSRAKSEYQHIGQRWATQNSKNTHEQLQSNPAEWHAYHAARDISFQGYDQSQIPRNRIIAYLEQQYKTRKMRVLDMGCGRGNIYQHFNQSKKHKLNIIGYDHVAEEGKNIRVGNILDLSGEEEDESADVCIYSQSLMGADKLKYLDEGYRILRHNGEFVISESSGMLDAVKAKLAELGCMVVKDENTVNEDTDEQYRWFLLVAIKR
jgi:superfamily II DNA or RNA helicase